MLNTATIDARAAGIMADIQANIAARAEAHRNRQAEVAANRAAAERADRECLEHAQACMNSRLSQAAIGSQAIFSLMQGSKGLQELILYAESRGKSYAPSYFRFFEADALGKREDCADDMHLYINLRSNGTIEIDVSHFDEEKPRVVQSEDVVQGLRDAMFGTYWNSRHFMETMFADYQRIPSPLSWNIPPDYYRESPNRFRLVALRVLAQCSRPQMLEKYMSWALNQYNTS